MESQTPRGIVCKAQPIHVSSVLPTEGFRVRCAVNGVMTSLLIDTGAVMTLLRKDTWDRVSPQATQELQPSHGLKLVGAGGSPLQSHGTAKVSLTLGEKEIPMDVVVASPLAADGIIGLDFLQKQRATIDLDAKQVKFAECRHTLPMYKPSSLLQTESLAESRIRHIGVRLRKFVEVPAFCELETTAAVDEVRSGEWLCWKVKFHQQLLPGRCMSPPRRA